MKTIGALSLALALAVPMPALSAEIVIAAEALVPATSQVALDELVTFVNRSGRFVHVEVIGPAGEHHVFAVGTGIRAEFHRPGDHPYVVHFYTGRPAELRGVVRVTGEARSPSPSECTGVTVEETCLER